jgi:hypothetical protein
MKHVKYTLREEEAHTLWLDLNHTQRFCTGRLRSNKYKLSNVIRSQKCGKDFINFTDETSKIYFTGGGGDTHTLARLESYPAQLHWTT